MTLTGLSRWITGLFEVTSACYFACLVQYYTAPPPSQSFWQTHSCHWREVCVVTVTYSLLRQVGILVCPSSEAGNYCSVVKLAARIGVDIFALYSGNTCRENIVCLTIQHSSDWLGRVHYGGWLATNEHLHVGFNRIFDGTNEYGRRSGASQQEGPTLYDCPY